MKRKIFIFITILILTLIVLSNTLLAEPTEEKTQTHKDKDTKKENSNTWMKILGAILIIGITLTTFIKIKRGKILTQDYFKRAAYFHKLSEKANKKGKDSKAKNFRQKAQLLREKGEFEYN